MSKEISVLDYSIWLSMFPTGQTFGDTGSLRWVGTNQKVALTRLRIKALANDAIGGFGFAQASCRLYLLSNSAGPLDNPPIFELTGGGSTSVSQSNSVACDSTCDWEGFMPLIKPETSMLWQIGGTIDPQFLTAVFAEVTLSAQFHLY